MYRVLNFIFWISFLSQHALSYSDIYKTQRQRNEWYKNGDKQEMWNGKKTGFKLAKCVYDVIVETDRTPISEMAGLCISLAYNFNKY